MTVLTTTFSTKYVGFFIFLQCAQKLNVSDEEEESYHIDQKEIRIKKLCSRICHSKSKSPMVCLLYFLLTIERAGKVPVYWNILSSCPFSHRVHSSLLRNHMIGVSSIGEFSDSMEVVEDSSEIGILLEISSHCVNSGICRG